jgi:hypothetical protein
VRDVVEILVHWHAGRRMGELSSSLGADPKTIRKYTAPAVAAGIVPGSPPLSLDQWSALASKWFPELVDHSYVNNARKLTPFRRLKTDPPPEDRRPHCVVIGRAAPPFGWSLLPWSW